MSTIYESYNENVDVYIAIPFLCIIVIAVIINIVAVYLIIINFFIKSKQNFHNLKMAWFSKYLSCATILLFAITNICQLIGICLYMVHIHFLIYWTHGDSWFWIISRYTMYSLFLARLIFTLKDSPFSYKCSHPGIISAICLFLLQIILSTILGYFISIGDKLAVIITLIFVNMTDPMFAVLVSVMFGKQLNRVADAMGKVEGHNSMYDKTHSQQKEHMQFLSLLRKYSILTFIGTLSSAITLIVTGIRYVYSNHIWVVWISGLFVSVDCTVSSISILLFFKFAVPWYQSLCKCSEYIYEMINRSEDFEKLKLELALAQSNTKTKTKSGNATPKSDVTNILGSQVSE